MTDRLPAASAINPSAAYYRKEKLDLDAWFKVTQIDYERLLEDYPASALFDCTGRAEIELLDLGCGTARFPCLLDETMPDGVQVCADLLDISDYCLDAAVAQYRALSHFRPALTYLSGIEALPTAVDRDRRFDAIWAIHSLCTVDRERLAEVFRCCVDLLRPNGKFFIYQLARGSSYDRLYDYYLAHHPAPNNTSPMLASEDLQRVLSALGLKYEIHKIAFTHTIAVEQRHLLEVYLKKCIMDSDTKVLEFFLPVLADCFVPGRAQYCFDQEVDFLIVDKGRNSGAPGA